MASKAFRRLLEVVIRVLHLHLPHHPQTPHALDHELLVEIFDMTYDAIRHILSADYISAHSLVDKLVDKVMRRVLPFRARPKPQQRDEWPPITTGNVLPTDTIPRSIGALYRSLPIPAIVRRSYADVLQSKYPAQPQSPVHKVFCTEELLEDILSHLPPLQLRNALLVCRRFRRCIDPKKCSRKMKRALGLDFTRRRWSDIAWEIYRLKRCYKIDHFHQNLLFNVSFSTSLTLGEEIVPVLQIAPFQRSSIMLSPGEDGVTVQLWLKSEDVNTEIRDLAPKGVVRLQSRGSVNMKLYDDRYRHSWKDVKIVKAAVVVKVLIRVDFRKVMIADMHNIGHCGFPFCHVGSHGLQEVSTTDSTT